MPPHHPLSEANNKNRPQGQVCGVCQDVLPTFIMTFLHNFLPKVVIRRNVDALALSKDQAIFFPKAPYLALHDKLDDGLGKRIMLEPLFMRS